MSSSEETDEEENRRISEAVFCNESRADLFSGGKNDPKSKLAQHDIDDPGVGVDQASAGAIPVSSKTFTNFNQAHHKDLQGSSSNCNLGKAGKTLEPHLKSKRPEYRQDDDEGINNKYVLKTTPEFRAFVAKHLEKVLDKELETCLTSSVWDSIDRMAEKGKEKLNIKRGIKLLSSSKCTIGEITREKTHSSTPSLMNKSFVKKPRLSTSSESSEDEKIQACVFTVNNIQEENERLASLISEGSTGTEIPTNPGDSSERSSSRKIEGVKVKDIDEDDSEKSKKKKKKRKKLKVKEKDAS